MPVCSIHPCQERGGLIDCQMVRPVDSAVMRMRSTSAIIYVVLVGCGPGKPSMQGESSEGGESTAGISTTIAPTSSGAEGSSGAASGSTSSIGLTATTSTGGSSTDGSSSDDGAFIIDDDAMSRCDPECDKFEQDCPAGQKCMPYSCDGGTIWVQLFYDDVEV